MSKNHGLMATPQVNLTYPVDTLGSRRERKGQEEHATSIILFESYIGNTGDLMKHGKEGGSRKARAVGNSEDFMRSRMGQRERATYIILLESYIVNTGDLMKHGKEGGSRKARAV